MCWLWNLLLFLTCVKCCCFYPSVGNIFLVFIGALDQSECLLVPKQNPICCYCSCSKNVQILFIRVPFSIFPPIFSNLCCFFIQIFPIYIGVARGSSTSSSCPLLTASWTTKGSCQVNQGVATFLLLLRDEKKAE